MSSGLESLLIMRRLPGPPLLHPTFLVQRGHLPPSRERGTIPSNEADKRYVVLLTSAGTTVCVLCWMQNFGMAPGDAPDRLANDLESVGLWEAEGNPSLSLPLPPIQLVDTFGPWQQRLQRSKRK